VAFVAMRRACELAGWAYRLVGEIDWVRAGNLRWLAGTGTLVMVSRAPVRSMGSRRSTGKAVYTAM
jgi:hypothetical protein